MPRKQEVGSASSFTQTCPENAGAGGGQYHQHKPHVSFCVLSALAFRIIHLVIYQIYSVRVEDLSL